MNKELIKMFDDVSDSEYGKWSQICPSCVKKLRIKERSLDNAGQGICGVEGCSNESDYYIDFD